MPKPLQKFMMDMEFIPYDEKKIKEWREKAAKDQKKADDKAADGGKKPKKGKEGGDKKKNEGAEKKKDEGAEKKKDEGAEKKKDEG